MNTDSTRLIAKRTSAAALIAISLAVFGLARPAVALQAPPPLRVIVADLVSGSGGSHGVRLASQATAAVSNEFIKSGAGQYYVFGTSEVQKEAKTLGIRLPSATGPAGHLSSFDLQRIAESLGANAIVQGTVTSSALIQGRPIRVVIDVRIHDVTCDEDISGGAAESTAAPRPGEASDPEQLMNSAVEDAAFTAVRHVLQRQIVTGTILNIEGSTAFTNIGSRNGVHVGDELTVYRLRSKGSVCVGHLKVLSVAAGDSQARIVQNTGGIQIEDLTHVVYKPDKPGRK